MVLGVGQDGGKPQIGNPDDPAWDDPTRRQKATSLAVVGEGYGNTMRYVFDATPDFKHQLQMLDAAFPVDEGLGLDGIFLTHAHIGHYTGLMFLGHESAGAKDIPVYAMPKMAEFLRTNGPWSQLVKYKNIELKPLSDQGSWVLLPPFIEVAAFFVPHRQEFSEVVGYRVEGPDKSVLFIPDIDSWEEWDDWGTHIEDMIAEVDIAYLDATFYANGEIPGRDMSGFPHPFITHSMSRFANLPVGEKAKIRFIHLNHTNPALDRNSAAAKTVIKNGFNLAEEGEILCLGAE